MKYLTAITAALTALCVDAPTSAQMRAAEYQTIDVCDRHGETISIAHGWGTAGLVEGNERFSVGMTLCNDPSSAGGHYITFGGN